MRFEVVRSLSGEVWRQLLNEQPDANIFHSPDFFDVMKKATGHNPQLWAVLNGEGQVLALHTPVAVTLMDGFLSRLTTRMISYGGILHAHTAESCEALDYLLQMYIQDSRQRALFTELRNLSDLSALQPTLQNNGFIYEDHLNFLIDLQRPAEEIWSSLHSNVRTNVRKARRLGVVVREVTSLDEVPAAYAVLANVYKRIQTPLAPPSLFRAAFEILHPRGMIKLLTAHVEDTCIGASVRLLYKNVIHAWYAGAIRDYASYKANDLLNWHILEWGAQNGFESFDFGGAGKPDEEYGPRKFKAKFNGTLVNYGRNTYIHHPHLLRFSQWGYELYRRWRY